MNIENMSHHHTSSHAMCCYTLYYCTYNIFEKSGIPDFFRTTFMYFKASGFWVVRNLSRPDFFVRILRLRILTVRILPDHLKNWNCFAQNLKQFQINIGWYWQHVCTSSLCKHLMQENLQCCMFNKWRTRFFHFLISCARV